MSSNGCTTRPETVQRTQHDRLLETHSRKCLAMSLANTYQHTRQHADTCCKTARLLVPPVPDTQTQTHTYTHKYMHTHTLIQAHVRTYRRAHISAHDRLKQTSKSFGDQAERPETAQAKTQPSKQQTHGVRVRVLCVCVGVLSRASTLRSNDHVSTYTHTALP